MSIAQDKAKANFKKAIAYRSKTGCSLKEAFAHIKGKKTVIKKKATVKKVGAIKKKTTPKKVAKKKAPKKLKYAGTAKAQHGKKMYKYSLGKKPTEKDVLKSIQKAEKVQKSHMLINGISGYSMNSLKFSLNELHNYELLLTKLKNEIVKQKKEGKSKASIISLNNWVKSLKSLIKEQKLHITQLKKHI